MYRKGTVDTFKHGEIRRYRFVYDERTEFKLKHFKFDDARKPLDEGRMLFHFHILDLDNPEQLKYGRDQEFLLARTHAVAILDELIAGHYDLEITRRGTSNLGTRYEVKPILPATTTKTAAAA
jgi:hypothetical protein